jgi:hypothetical protein
MVPDSCEVFMKAWRPLLDHLDDLKEIFFGLQRGKRYFTLVKAFDTSGIKQPNGNQVLSGGGEASPYIMTWIETTFPMSGGGCTFCLFTHHSQLNSVRK